MRSRKPRPRDFAGRPLGHRSGEPGEPFAPLLGGLASHVATTNRRRCEFCAVQPACTPACADDIERALVSAGRRLWRPSSWSRYRYLTPPEGYFARVREICDKYGVLLISEEAICEAWSHIKSGNLEISNPSTKRMPAATS